MKNKIHKQLGVTLIELMIALTLGLLLSGAAVMIYLANKNTYSNVSDNSRMQENARYAMSFLTKAVWKSGWKVEPTHAADNPFRKGGEINSLDKVSWDRYALLKVVNNSKKHKKLGNKPNSDLLIIRFQGSGNPADQTMTDCRGTARSDNDVVTELYYVNEKNELICVIVSDGANPKKIPLIKGVENLQILIGEDDKNRGYAEKYVNASAVNKWSNIASVQIGILVTSGIFTHNANNKNADGTNKKYKILDVNNVSISNSRLYGQVFSTTVSLRNGRS
ncbi:PilW family protein [Zooshikella ganghwensis]|uniref:PilW family protein n=1 Tax=Zooshikella ganghwensis TaxID=202772 RepID=UPI00040326A9|nr:PilW family protein [Zooshikella ganghwensis]